MPDMCQMSEGVGTLIYQTQQLNLFVFQFWIRSWGAKEIQINFVFALQYVVIRDDTYWTNMTN